ncbi:type I polyketide synthase [Streptomyces avermitilis]
MEYFFSAAGAFLGSFTLLLFVGCIRPPRGFLMAKDAHRVVAVGVARRDRSDIGATVASTVWAAIEDAGVVPSDVSPVVVFSSAETGDPAEWRELPGVRVQAPLADDPFTAALDCLRGEHGERLERPDTVVVYDVSEPAGAVAVVLAHETPGVDHYGPIVANPDERLAQLAALSPRARTSSPGTGSGSGFPFAVPLLLSGRSEGGLRAHAGTLADHLLAHPDLSLTDTALTQATARTVWPRRAVVTAADRDTAVGALRALAAGLPSDHLIHGEPRPHEGAVFVFPGQGAQWLGMARELAASAPVFRDKLAECGRALRPFVDFDLDDVLSGVLPLERVEVIQPALFAVMVSLSELWRSNGVVPAAMVGHSFGEIAAVTAAGGLSLEDGARLVAAVGKGLARLQGQGEMVAVSLSAEDVADLIAQWGLDLDIAVVNGPRATVVAGPPDAAGVLLDRLSARGVRARLLPIGIAGHSHRMDAIREFIVEQTAPVRPRVTRTTVWTSVSTEPLDTANLGAEHWYDSMRKTARFQDVIETLLGAGHRVFIEMSPHPVLGMSIEETAAHIGREAVVLDTMRRDDAGYDRYVRALAEAHLHGVVPAWTTVLTGARRVTLPGYRLDRDLVAVDGGLRERLARHAPADRLREVVGLVTGLLPAQDEEMPALPEEQDFRSLGIDSVGALRVRDRLNEATGLRLPATVLFDCPNIRLLAEEVLNRLFGTNAAEAAGTAAQAVRAAPADPEEPIAIVGMACHYPGGVDSPDDLWEMVRHGRDAISAFPADRGWDIAALYDADADRPGTFYQREAALLKKVGDFDADFFGISPREALAMDPQQRLLLETTWEAIENGGIDAAALRSTLTGVFIGAMNLPYGTPPHQARPDLEGYVVTGTTSSVASGRISYLLGLEGPAITVDTACSSSLVALHLACQALRNGECDMALAGGVAVMSTPTFFVEYSRQRVLSGDGRCKSFSADGDGTGWSEGVGVLVVERLSDARRLGHRVLAVVRGSAVNQDGASNGMTAPSGPAQQRVIGAALRQARLTAADVDLVEAHGTGTRLGDPIEAQALIATYGTGHSADSPLYLGSLKSNIGHAQAAAGVAGVIKSVQAMRHRTLPRSLYAGNPTAEVDWSAGTVQLLTENRAWPATDRPRRAAVSSFGMSGTNAHVILEEFVEEPVSGGGAADVGWAGVAVPLVVSGKSVQAVRDQARALHGYLERHPDVPLLHVARGLATGRTHFPFRAAVTGTREEVLAALADVAPVQAGVGRIAALFSGQGSQRVGMGRELAAHFPVFADALEEACAHIDPHLPRPLRDVMFGTDAEVLNRTEYTQPALFAYQTALARLWQSWGVSFTAVLGHSIGEIAAAHVAGVLSLPDAALLAAVRGRLMQGLPEGGAMAAIEATPDEVRPLLDVEQVDIAAVNGPNATVVSGSRVHVEDLAAHFRGLGRRTTALSVSHAFHSPHITPVLDELSETLARLEFHEPSIPIVPAADSPHLITTPEYWRDQARTAVQFHRAVDRIPASEIALEISPHPTLAPHITTPHITLPGDHSADEVRTTLSTFAELHTRGAATTWTSLLPPTPHISLPTYPFQHKHHWLASSAPTGTGADAVAHPFLTGVTELPVDGGLLLTGRISPSTDPWLDGHAIAGTVLFPGAGFLELALQAARLTGDGRVADLVVQAPLALPATGADVQVWVSAQEDTGREFVIRAREDGGEWTVHATGSLAAQDVETAAEWAVGQWPPADTEEVPVQELYEELTDRGYEYGPAFRGLRAVWQAGDETFADVVLPEGAHDTRFLIHPALLDAALHTFAATHRSGQELRLPFAFTDAAVHAQGSSALRVRLRIDGDTARFDAASATGDPVLSVGDLALRAVDNDQLAPRAGAPVDRLRYEVKWQPVDDSPSADRVPGTWLLLAPPTADLSWTADLLQDTVAVTLDGTTDRARLSAALPTTDLAGVLCVAEHPDALLTGVQALSDAGVDAKVWCLTRGAEDDPDTAAVWGVGRVAALELPDVWGGLVDIPETVDERVAGYVAGLLRGELGEDQVQVRADGVYVRRLVKAGSVGNLSAWTPSGTVLVTGGTGALGGHVARWLAGLGGCTLLLVSRQGLNAPGARELVKELTEAGTPTRVVAADVTDRAAMAELVREAAAGGVPVRSVFHTAGVADQTPLLETSPEDFHTVLAGKVGGALVLDELLPDVDAFVLFSSISGIWGAAGQAGYGAGNAALHGLAARRRAQGLKATALAWGPWAGGGMAAGGMEQQLRRLGLVPLPVADATSALARSVALGTDCVLVEAAWSRFLPTFTAARPAPFFERLTPRTHGQTAGPATQGLADIPAADRARVLLDLVRTSVAAAVGHSDASRIDPDRPLRELGFDSLMSVQLRNRLSAAAGLQLPATLVFDYPTSAALAEHLHDTLFAEPDRSAVSEAPVAADTSEPIAIVGLACRYPGGVTSPEDLWRLVSEGGDAIGGFPTDRGWDLGHLYDPDQDRVGRTYAREGGFIDDPAGFDAGFFGISPREALAMDPQHRLLLETSWQAFEDAGIDPETLRGSRTGVFAGVMYNDYVSRLGTVPDELEGILGIANSNSVMSGRISYLLGLEGPAITVDTACSSSLVALHLACQALRNGECDMALAGGATVMASPNVFVEFSRQGGLAKDGRCKSFSADGDGTGWSEGVGVLVVERLSVARRLGHRVLAVVRGSAVNQDGASNGMTAPSGPAQQRVIGAALRQARLTAADVDLVEAHGTGTRLGDPIEAQALIATYGTGHSADSPLYLGSLKSNIGHAQAAAGVAGVIKSVQAMRHRTLPRSLYAGNPTAEVDWSAGTVQLLTENRAWPATDRPRRAAVSSFGISGTNAHVILEEGDVPGAEPEPTSSAGPLPILLSARTPSSLPAQARALHAHLLAHPDLGLPDVAWSLATTRSTFQHRAVVVAENHEGLLQGLAALADPDPEAVRPASVVTGTASRGRTVLMFPGQGSQWPGMARDLLAGSEVFATSIRECEEALAPWVDWSLSDVLADADPAALDRVDVVQPVLFAMMVSLARMWQAWGVQVDGVVGHSQGEIAAACVSGALSLADSARVVATRSRLLGALSGTGGMVFVGLPADEVRGRLDDRLSVAAVNGPASVVVSGPDDALAELMESAQADGVHVRRVDVDYASHSASVEAIREQLISELADIAPREGAVPLYSTVTDGWLSGSELDAEYWYRNLRQTVRFHTAVEALAAEGFGFFAECSPHPVLTIGVRETLEGVGANGVAFGSLRRGDGAVDSMLLSLAEGHTGGLPVAWDRVLAPGGRVALPAYAFHHERFWLDPVGGTSDAVPLSELDAQFWDAVENEDVDRLTHQMGRAEGLAEALPALAAWRRGTRRQSTLDSWRYDVVWRDRPVAPGASPSGRWLLLTSGTPESGQVRKALEAAGLELTALELGGDDADRTVLAARVNEVAEHVGDFAGVLSLLALDERQHPTLPGLTTGLALTVAAFQAFGDIGLDAPLWALTCGAVGIGEAARRPVQNQMWGLGRVAALEHPKRWGGLVDVPEDIDAPAAKTLLAVLADGGGEDQWVVRGSGAWVRRLARRAPAAPAAGAAWKPSGTVLITGATGSLGPHLARSFAERGATRMALLSRRGDATPGMAELVADLERIGCTATVFACDVRDRGRLDAVLRELEAAGHPVTTAVHAAAHLDIAPLETTTLDEFADVVNAKVAGTVHLTDLLDREHLRELVLFSSIAGVWGSGDHGAYAAANAFLDSHAERCRADGLPVLSVAWGIWDEQVTKDRTDADAVVRRGLPFLDRATAFEGMYQAMSTDEAFQVIADVDWSRFVPVFTSVRPSPLLAELPETADNPQRQEPSGGSAATGLRERLAAMTPADRERSVLELVQAHSVAALGHGADGRLAPNQEFRGAGFDSLLSVDLRNRLGRATGLSLPPTLVFDYTTPARVAGYLLGELFGEEVLSADAVLARLTQLETDIRALLDDDTARMRLRTRIGALLSSVDVDGSEDADADLESADSTEELLNLLDSRFGEE